MFLFDLKRTNIKNQDIFITANSSGSILQRIILNLVEITDSKEVFLKDKPRKG